VGRATANDFSLELSFQAATFAAVGGRGSVLGPVFAAVTRLIEPTARDHGVTIAAAPVPNGVHVRASEADLEHVLLNLLLNAVQACSRGGNVALSVHSADDVRIRVSDDGCGIPPDRLRLIFEPFVSGRPGGTGLGLFLSLDFVRKWGGDISVSSKRGSGTTFEVVLPAAEHPPAGPGPMRVRP
jgi:signal transduction histidine kinase